METIIDERENVNRLHAKYMALSYELMAMPGYLNYLMGENTNPLVIEKAREMREAHNLWYITAREFENK